ncbi:MAG: lamin tail domain-containing protein [Bacteroidota bacterium]
MRKFPAHKIALPLFIILAGFAYNGLQAQLTHLVISQVYGGAGCATAGCSTFQNDYIEILNPTGVAVSLNGKSVQYASAEGTTWAVTMLPNVILQPGQYYLIAGSFNANGTSPLPTPDVTGVFSMNATTGKVALVDATTALTGTCPSDATIIDLVGYGTANCFEAANAPAPSTTTAIFRLSGGCTDAQNNYVDFEVLNASPRNTASAFQDCSINYLSITNVSQNEGNAGTTSFTFIVRLSLPAPIGGVTFDIATANGTATIANADYVQRSLTGRTIPPGNTSYIFTVMVNGNITAEPDETFFVNVSNVVRATVSDAQGKGTILNDDLVISPIHTIQGNANSSPLVSQNVITRGIVTGLKSTGFFIQDPNPDADANTSEGIFVFTGFTPGATYAIGNDLQVSGTVSEYVPGQDVYSPSMTQLSISLANVLSTGNALPEPVILNADELLVNNLNNLEKYEGMLVQVNSLTVTGPTEGLVVEANAAVTSSGYFYGVITGTARPFREPGVQLPDPLPPGAPVDVPRWDANPEIVGIDSKAQPGSSVLNVATGAVLTNVVGPLDYVKRCYTIDVDAAATPGISNNNLTFTAIPAAATSEVSIASLNMHRFFDATDDPVLFEPVLSSTAYNNRLNKASLTIRQVLNYPDVIGVQEVENLLTLQAIATKVNNDAVALALPNPNYQPYLLEGNDISGIDVGFLVKSPKITVSSVTQFGKAATYINPVTASPETLYDRPPLLLMATFLNPGCGTSFPFTIITNHLQSLLDIANETDGARVRAKRKAQAEYLANLIQTRQTSNSLEKIAVMGDFNAYQFNDGYTDVIGTIKGTPAIASQVVASSPDLVNPDLKNLNDTYDVSKRYSSSFTGSAQALDHVLITQNLSAQVANYGIAKLGADFPEIFYGNSLRPERLTDHDVPVVYFNFTCSSPSLATDYFRTKASGNWNNISTWESSSDNTNWHAATLTPDFNANTITILNGHAVAVSTNVTVDQLIINPGSAVSVNTGIVFTVK